MLVCIDDKHCLKVGELGFPVVGKVIVRAGTTFEAGGHDFTIFSIIPSVVLVNDIPDSIQEYWYRGQVLVGFENAAFEPSTPMRHATELVSILSSNTDFQTLILFLYSDGGPDHRVKYISVQVSLIALFLKLDLNFLEHHQHTRGRIMSTLNLAVVS